MSTNSLMQVIFINFRKNFGCILVHQIFRCFFLDCDDSLLEALEASSTKSFRRLYTQLQYIIPFEIHQTWQATPSSKFLISAFIACILLLIFTISLKQSRADRTVRSSKHFWYQLHHTLASRNRRRYKIIWYLPFWL